MHDVNVDLIAETQAALLERIKGAAGSPNLTIKATESLARSYAMLVGNPQVPVPSTPATEA